jgi:hypothetical protein
MARLRWTRAIGLKAGVWKTSGRRVHRGCAQKRITSRLSGCTVHDQRRRERHATHAPHTIATTTEDVGAHQHVHTPHTIASKPYSPFYSIVVALVITSLREWSMNGFAACPCRPSRVTSCAAIVSSQYTSRSAACVTSISSRKYYFRVRSYCSVHVIL